MFDNHALQKNLYLHIVLHCIHIKPHPNEHVIYRSCDQTKI